jgi:hypothetical protein
MIRPCFFVLMLLLVPYRTFVGQEMALFAIERPCPFASRQTRLRALSALRRVILWVAVRGAGCLGARGRGNHPFIEVAPECNPVGIDRICRAVVGDGDLSGTKQVAIFAFPVFHSNPRFQFRQRSEA